MEKRRRSAKPKRWVTLPRETRGVREPPADSYTMVKTKISRLFCNRSLDYSVLPSQSCPPSLPAVHSVWMAPPTQVISSFFLFVEN